MQSLFIGTMCLVATATVTLGHDFKGFDDSVMYDIGWELGKDFTSVSVTPAQFTNLLIYRSVETSRRW